MIKNRAAINGYLSLLVLALAAIFTAKILLNKQSENAGYAADEVSVETVEKSSAKTVDNVSHVETEPLATGLSELLIEPRIDPQEHEVTPLLEPVGVDDPNNLNSLVLLLNSLEQFQGFDWAQSIDGFIEQIEQSETITKELLLALSQFQIPSPNENTLLIAILSSIDSQTIEEDILDILENEGINEQPELLSILRDRGVVTPRAREYLLGELSMIEGDQILVSAIKSMTPTSTTPQEIASINESMQPLYRSDSSTVRSAAIESLIGWNGSENIPLINEALFDSSTDVRQSALFAISGSGITDPRIKGSLIQILADDNENMGLRIQAFHALGSYELVADEYEKYYQFEYMLIENDTGTARG